MLAALDSLLRVHTTTNQNAAARHDHANLTLLSSALTVESAREVGFRSLTGGVRVHCLQLSACSSVHPQRAPICQTFCERQLLLLLAVPEPMAGFAWATAPRPWLRCDQHCCFSDGFLGWPPLVMPSTYCTALTCLDDHTK